MSFFVPSVAGRGLRPLNFAASGVCWPGEWSGGAGGLAAASRSVGTPVPQATRRPPCGRMVLKGARCVGARFEEFPA